MDLRAVALVIVTGCGPAPEAVNAMPISSSDAAAGEPAAGGGSITLSRREPRVGDKCSHQVSQHMRLDLKRKGKHHAFEDTIAKEVTEEVLAVEGGAVTKVTVTYYAWTTHRLKNSKDTIENKPVAGKSYVVELRGSDIVVTDTDGARPPEQEEKVVRDDFDGDLGAPDPFVSNVPTRAIGPGERVAELETGLDVWLNGKDVEGAQYGDIKVTLDGPKRDVAVFAVQMDLSQETTSMLITAPMEGTMELGVADGQLRRFVAEGTLQARPSRTTPESDITGKGLVVLKVTTDCP